MPTIFDTSFDTLKKSIAHINPARIVVISDRHVAPLHLGDLLEQLPENTFHLIAPAGEQSKSRQTKALIEDFLLDNKCSRDTLLIALGGGMITDLVGFVGATYCRGIPTIFIPTSLMAMIDASIGGKNGINTEHGKNLLGTIRLPDAVIINPSYLLTLPDREYRSAFSEIIKYALIDDRSLFNILQSEAESLLKKDMNSITPVIKRCVAIKEKFVAEDLYDQGKRALLNFGHTIGHAIEKTCDYQINHGQAVGLGLYYESLLSQQYKLLSQDSLNEIAFLLDTFSLKVMPSKTISLEQLMSALMHDKKTQAGITHCSLLSGIGKPHLNPSPTHPIPEEDMAQVFELFLLHKKTGHSKS